MPIIRGDNYEQNTRMIDAEMAAWIGLNESIFLEQLNFILTKKEGKGKYADGKKWYRDTPKAFVITYFPFWDESVVKRTIANLRADGLLLARSDLNEDHKDRSLWYTINYSALENLTGPVDRVLGKMGKRKEARAARKDKDNTDGYTKVQNVLLTTEVQSVPDSESTKCTSERVQNVPLPQVQNVPTPKESLILEDSLLKESPNGVGETPPLEKGVKPKTIIKDKFIELSLLQMPSLKSDERYWWSQFGEILHLARGDPALACKWEVEAIGYMRANHLTITGPQSILGMIRALASGQSLQQKNGVTYGNPILQRRETITNGNGPTPAEVAAAFEFAISRGREGT